jgi:hypothetical protein
MAQFHGIEDIFNLLLAPGSSKRRIRTISGHMILIMSTFVVTEYSISARIFAGHEFIGFTQQLMEVTIILGIDKTDSR